jgi:adenosine deaminase
LDYNQDVDSFYADLPKVELHLHLEGAIPLPALWELVQKYGAEDGLTSLDDLRKRFVFRDFPHFIETWIWKNGYIREYDDFTFFAEAVARDLAVQKVRYVEAFFSAPDFHQRGLQFQPIAQAIRAGLDRVPEVEIALIADLVRDFGPELAARTLAQVEEVREYGILGVGIGGSEQDYPPEPFAPVYRRARELGLHTTAHAGEAAGAPSIWGALKGLDVERIGHGTRAKEDPRLLDYLAERRIPIEMCPLSNVRTGVTSSIEAHPIHEYYRRGLLVTTNTDDPKMFHNSLAEEYQMLVERLGFTPDELREVILNGIRASWLPEERKLEMEQQFTSNPKWKEFPLPPQ